MRKNCFAYSNMGGLSRRRQNHDYSSQHERVREIRKDGSYGDGDLGFAQAFQYSVDLPVRDSTHVHQRGEPGGRAKSRRAAIERKR